MYSNQQPDAGFVVATTAMYTHIHTHTRKEEAHCGRNDYYYYVSNVDCRVALVDTVQVCRQSTQDDRLANLNEEKERNCGSSSNSNSSSNVMMSMKRIVKRYVMHDAMTMATAKNYEHNVKIWNEYIVCACSSTNEHGRDDNANVILK